MKSLPKNTTILVASGDQAKFFEQDPNATSVSLKYVDEEKPGTFADQGPSGKTPPDMSAKEQMEATFSKVLAERLYERAHNGEFDALVIIADPGTLGEVRAVLHDEVRNKIVMELDKTLVNSPVKDIEASVSSALD